MCHVLPVLMVLCLAGAGLALWQTVGKQEPRPVAAPAGEPLTFSVNIKLPQDAAGSTCNMLFYQGKGGEGGTVVSDARVALCRTPPCKVFGFILLVVGMPHTAGGWWE
jgi:hypothetical protein